MQIFRLFVKMHNIQDNSYLFKDIDVVGIDTILTSISVKYLLILQLTHFVQERKKLLQVLCKKETKLVQVTNKNVDIQVSVYNTFIK